MWLFLVEKEGYMNTVIVFLKGGLGNQMFQYAAARSIVRGKNIIFDTSFFSRNDKASEIFTPRVYELSIFKNIQSNVAGKYLLNLLYSQQLHCRILRKITFTRLEKICQKENEYIPYLRQLKTPAYLDGYFQSEKYFKHIREELLHEFKFPDLDKTNLEQLDQIHSHAEPVSIHVRRGDYLKSYNAKIHGILPLSYYKRAIEEIKSSVRKPHFFIFSTDQEWCAENFSFLGKSFTIIKPNSASDAWKDMYLMAQCKHHIVANSSFSWWGAWLSKEDGSINIAPYEWFNPAVVKFDINDFVPAKWKIAYYD
jgi:hypothetical protein